MDASKMPLFLPSLYLYTISLIFDLLKMVVRVPESFGILLDHEAVH